MLTVLLLSLLQAAAAPGTNDAQRLYIVGANDVLTITVYNQPQLTGKFVVEADGTFAYPLLGRVAAGGLSIRAVEDKVRQGLADGFLKDPQISVTVDQYRSQQIFVMGEVKQPGPLPFTGAMTLIEALARAGSITERAGSEAVIVHSAPGAAAAPASNFSESTARGDAIHIDLEKLQRGTLTQDATLRPGDTIFVPRADTVFVSGQVRMPGEYHMRTGMTVRQALALAGGVTDRGSTRRVQIIRVVDGKETTINGDLQKTVQSGDTIVVNERFF
jgi:polysaccharide export outer membrane protein